MGAVLGTLLATAFTAALICRGSSVASPVVVTATTRAGTGWLGPPPSSVVMLPGGEVRTTVTVVAQKPNLEIKILNN